MITSASAWTEHWVRDALAQVFLGQPGDVARSVRVGLGAVERAQARAAGRKPWSPRADADHPTGGYRGLSVTALKASSRRWNPRVAVQAEFTNALGHFHRQDGPSRIFYRVDGRVDRVSYHRRGRAYRCDGPAIVRPDETGAEAIFHSGAQVLSGHDRSAQDTVERFAELVEGGCAPAEAVTWMEVANALAHRGQDPDQNGDPRRCAEVASLVEDLRERGVAAQAAQERLALLAPAGLSDSAVMAVLTRRAPASWATS